MTEKQTDVALIVVRITNENRLNADVTEDFFLVPIKQYTKAIQVIKGMETTTSGTVARVKAKLDTQKIDYEHILDGTRIFIGIDESDDNIANEEG